jgi:hypothetical protein
MNATEILASILNQTTSLLPKALFASLGIPRDKNLRDAKHLRLTQQCHFVSTESTQTRLLQRKCVPGASRVIFQGRCLHASQSSGQKYKPSFLFLFGARSTLLLTSFNRCICASQPCFHITIGSEQGWGLHKQQQ